MASMGMGKERDVTKGVCHTGRCLPFSRAFAERHLEARFDRYVYVCEAEPPEQQSLWVRSGSEGSRLLTCLGSCTPSGQSVAALRPATVARRLRMHVRPLTLSSPSDLSQRLCKGGMLCHEQRRRVRLQFACAILTSSPKCSIKKL